MSVIFIVLRYGRLYFDLYIFFFGLSALFGYKLFLRDTVTRNKGAAMLEALEVEKNSVISKISHKEQGIIAAKGRLQRYISLKDITETLSSTLHIADIENAVTESALNIVGRSDRALLFLVDKARQELNLASSKLSGGSSPVKAKKGEIFDTWILKQRRPLIIEDLDNEFRFSAEALRNTEDMVFKSVIGVPVIAQKKVIGVLRMDSKVRHAYSQDDLRLLNIIADLSAVAIGNGMLYKRTNELAITDGLTGIYVQRYFKEKLQAELKRSFAAKKEFSILMMDLDHFKLCNDKYGHTAGDIILIKVAGIIKECVGSGHMVARYGGEEFAALLFEAGKKEAIRVVEAVRQKIQASIFILRRNKVSVTISAGVSSFPEDGYGAEELLKKADENLYKAKESGRNKVWPGPV